MDISLIAETRFSWFELASWIAIAKMVVGFGFLIFVHELGHFLAAKACGVRCDKFYIGFDAFDIKIGDFVLIPRRLFHFQWGETEYGIGIIPLGGYVKMLGQVDNPAEQQAEFARVRGEGGDTEAGGTESPKAGEENIEGNEPLDPRSFPAKSVPQRLFIISAGVVMNLIFAVVLAMIAFSMGAPFQPAVVGGVVAGGPAWMADVQPGTRILHVNGDSKPPEHLRWVDIASGVALTGIGHEVTLEVLEPASETPKDLTLVPTGELNKARNVSIGSVGIEPVSSNQLADNDKAIFAGMAASTAEPPLMPADRVVAVNGVETAFGHDLKRELLIHYDEPVTLTVQRLGGKPTDKVENRPVEQLEIVVQPQPYLDYGISVGFGPIAAVQPGSPAATAGLQPGDQIQAIDDQPIADIVLLPGMMRRAARSGQTVKFTILRGEGTIDLSVQPRLPRMLLDAPGHMPMGIDELGITVELLTEIAAVRTGSPADAAGLKAGDSLVSAQFLEGGTTLTAKSKLRATPEEFTFEEWPQIWPTIMDVTQLMASENELKLVVQRGDEKQTVRLKPVRLDGEWSRGRGFSLQPYEEILTAYSFSEAVSLGFREAKESTFQVYLTLRQIMRGRVSVINLRGPGTIAAGATQMALRGDAVLLLFLTLISANLAVVNFLPIPVLDGGHAVFLIYEGIFGKPPSERVYVMLSYIGLFMLIGLMLFVLTLDAFQWIIP